MNAPVALEMLPTRKAEDWRYADLAALAPHWPLPASESIIVAPDGEFVRSIVQHDGITRLALDLGRGARAAVHILALGGTYGRVEVDVTLREGADFALGGVILGSDAQTLEIITQVRHVEPNATSRQIIRSALGGSATGSFLGKVAVARHAIGTDASQSVRAMLLSPTATANARPELEIYADDVKCAHGCAVGQLDAAALFYLASRGIAPPAAKALMLQAFIAEALATMGAGAGDADHLRALALARLEMML